MAFRTAFVRSVGGFPEELDAGMPTESGGDTYLVYRVLRAGFRAVYEPRALAFHHHRNDSSALARVISGYGTGTFSYLARVATVDRDPEAVITGVKWATARFVRDPLRTVLQRPRSTPLHLLAAEARGAVKTVRAYPAARDIVAARRPVFDGPVPLERPPVDKAVSAPAVVLEELPSLSVVIPTRGRRELVSSLVQALDRQEYPRDRLGIVVAVDGDIDGSAAAIRSLSLQRSVEVVVLDPPSPNRGQGAAAARNAGVEAARGSLLLFLDDDVEPVDDRLLVAHAARHGAAREPVALVGPCPPMRWDVKGRHAQTVRNWWVDHMQILTEDQALGFADVLTGNLSCRREDFLSVGGFRRMPRREDWELGYRLMLAGIPMAAAPDAVVLHDADLDLRSAMGDRVSEGAGDVAFARAHPGVAGLLPLAYWPNMRSAVRFGVGQLFGRGNSQWHEGVLDRDVRLLNRIEALGSHRGWARLYRRTTMFAYWTGAARELASEAELLELLSHTRRPDDPLHVVDLDDLDATAPMSPPVVAGEMLITVGGEVLGTAPVSLGGVPWRRDVLLRRLVASFREQADLVRMRRCLT